MSKKGLIKLLSVLVIGAWVGVKQLNPVKVDAASVLTSEQNSLQKGKLAVGKSELWYMVGTNLANDQHLVPSLTTPYYGDPEISSSFLAGRNNFNLWAPNNSGTYERWVSAHNDSWTNATQGSSSDGMGSSRLLIGSLYQNETGFGSVGGYPDDDFKGSQVADQTRLVLDNDGILTEELSYRYKIEGQMATFSDQVRFVPTAWGSILIQEHVVNQSHRQLRGIFFGRAIDTDMRPFNTNDYGSTAIGDKVAIKYLGQQRGLYEDQVIPAQGPRPNSNGTPANYPGGAARLSYNFSMHDHTGPDAWRALEFSTSVINGNLFIMGAFRNAVNDYGQARTNGQAGQTAFSGGDTAIAMMWFAKDLPSGASRDLSYEVSINGQGQYKSPEVTLAQSPTIDYSGRALTLNGTVTDLDNQHQTEELRYQIFHQDGTESQPQRLTTVTNQQGQAVPYQGTLDPQTNHLAVGDWLYIWAVDADDNPSVNQALTTLVAPAAVVTQQLRNQTTGGQYAAQVQAHVGDQIDYQSTFEMTSTATAPLAAGATLTTQVPATLAVQPNSGQLDYYDAQHQLIGQQLISGSSQWVTTNRTVPIGGQVVWTYRAQVMQDEPATVTTTTKVTGGGLTNELQSNPATLTIAKNLMLQTATQTIANLTAGTPATNRQIDGQAGDQLQMHFQVKVTGQSSGAGLSQLQLTTHINGTQYADRGGQLAKLPTGNVAYRLNQTGDWQTVTQVTPTADGLAINLTLPANRTLKAGDQVELRYTQQLITAPAANQYLYQDGQFKSAVSTIQPAAANTVRVKAPAAHRLTVRYVDLDADLVQPTLIANTESALGRDGQRLSDVLPGRLSPKKIKGYTITTMTTSPSLATADWQPTYRDDLRFERTDKTVTYGYHKAMIAISAPTDWDFGDYNQVETDSIYYLKTKQHQPQQVSVVDHYGVANWQLNVQQDQQFTDQNHHKLTGAQLQVTHGTSNGDKTNTAHGQLADTAAFKLTPAGPAQALMHFTRTGTYQATDEAADTSNANQPYTDSGKGIWHYQFGNYQSANYSVGLHVPASTKRYQGHYQTELTWSLTVAP